MRSKLVGSSRGMKLARILPCITISIFSCPPFPFHPVILLSCHSNCSLPQPNQPSHLLTLPLTSFTSDHWFSLTDSSFCSQVPPGLWLLGSVSALYNPGARHTCFALSLHPGESLSHGAFVYRSLHVLCMFDIKVLESCRLC